MKLKNGTMKMTKVTLSLASVGLIAVFAGQGCATVPKPQELATLEKSKQAKEVKTVRKTQSKLVAKSDASQEEATKAWKKKKLDTSRYYARLGQVQLDTALALQAQKDAKAEIKRVAEASKTSGAKVAELDGALASVNEKLALYEKIDQKDGAFAAHGTLAERIDAAVAAVDEAAKVNADKYAQAPFTQAQTELVAAREARTLGNVAQAQKSAEAAIIAAKQAYTIAKPQYNEDAAKGNVAERDAAIQRDLAAVAGVSPKLRQVGSVRQVAVTIQSAFATKGTEITSARAPVVMQVADVLKKHPEYKVLVVGFTSFGVRAADRYSVSQTRAQNVANYLVQAGVDRKRISASGRGAEEFVDKRKFNNANDRVEIIVVLKSNS